MILKSLELFGFKTFPDKTRLEFDKGITAVVGPNGSGKSNISDAIRWVFGEQSTKNLRCTKMEDVIFEGTVNRKSKGFAKVSLTIENKDRKLSFDSDDVTITRKFYRSGESDYLINNVSVRLKDIYELFMDTGLGKDGYSVISQGKIDSVVSSKSSDRREIFEEAAGISKFRYRKVEAERQLDKTKSNLIRIGDIIMQLEKRIQPLKDQSEKAKKFIEYSNEKKSLEIGIWLETLLKSEQSLREQDNKIYLASKRSEDANNRLDSIRKDMENNFLETTNISSKINDERQNFSNFEKDINEKDRNLSVLKNEVLHIKESNEKINLEIDDLKSQEIKLVEELDILDYKISEKISNKNKIDEDIKIETVKLDDLNEKVGKADKINNEISSHISNVNSELTELRLKILNSKSVIEQTNLTSEKIINSINENIKLKSNLQLELNQYKSNLLEKNDKKIVFEKEITKLKGILKKEQEKYDLLQIKINNLDLLKKEKASKKNILENLENNFEGFTKSVKFIMSESKRNHLKGVYGPISRLFEVLPEYTLAIEIALGASMQNIVVESEEDAKRCILSLKQNNIGRATFLPVNSIKPRGKINEDLTKFKGIIGIASDLCRIDHKYKNVLDFLLGRTIVVEDINSAIHISKRLNYKFKILTLDGQVINAGGSLTGGSSNKSSGLISRINDIEKLKNELDYIDNNLLNLNAEHKLLSEKLSGYKFKLSEFDKNLSVLLDEINADNFSLKSYEQKLNFLDSEIKKLKLEEQDTKDKIKNLELSNKDLELEESGLNDELLKLKGRLSNVNLEYSEIIESRRSKKDYIQSLQMSKIAQEKDIEILNTQKNNIIDSINNAKKKISLLIDERKLYLKKSDKLNENIEVLKNQMNNIIKLKDKSQKNVECLKQKRIDLEKINTDLRASERETLDEREALNRELVRFQERGITLQQSYDDIIAKLWDEYELTRSEAEKITPKLEDITKAKNRLLELKLKIKKLGYVNLASVDEYKEVSEQYRFMKSEFDDIEKSRNEIIKNINKLVKDMQILFVRKFDEINRNFKEIFKELFLGGRASLELLDEENVLTSGIEIRVAPPGKIVSHIESLSGGEKALVSIALYFAIMKVNPPPFCVLDEIEAALDDVNVTRFAKYLRKINEQTQFILITHRRGSMEEADVLYGVTMQEQGVSKLLKLKITEIAKV